MERRRIAMKKDNSGKSFVQNEKRQLGYKVPQGYFEDLNRTILSRANQMQTEKDKAENSRPTFRVQMRSAAVFAASFAAMVVLAITGYYFTGHQAVESEFEAGVSTQDMLIYSIDEYDMIELIGQRDSTWQNLIADASIDYFDVYGYPEAELLEK